MNIKSILTKGGSSLLKEVPFGDKILELVGDKIDGSVNPDILTAEETLTLLETLEPEITASILEKQLDQEHELKMKQEEDGSASKSRYLLSILLGSTVVILVLMLAVVILYGYIVNDIIPDNELLYLVIGVPVLLLIGVVGTLNKDLTALIVNLLMVASKKK